MKKLSTILVTMFFVHCIFAQQLGLNPDFKPTWENLNDNSRVDEQGTITWLTSEVEATSFGSSSKFTIMPLMEFNVNDISYFEGGKIKSIEKIMFFLNSQYVNVISSKRVVILQGGTLAAATEKFSQELSQVTGGWNTVELSSPYQIDPTMSLFIGYEVITSGGGYPASVASGTNPKQGWLKWNGSVDNLLPDDPYGFLIKAIATLDQDETAIKLESISAPSYIVLNDVMTVKGSVKNIGANKEAITSFSASYKIDGEEITEDFTDLNITYGNSYEFTFSTPFTFTELKEYTIDVKISNPNGISDNEVDNSINKVISVVSVLVPRAVLHEGFSSSTCGPCYNGNIALKEVLDAADPDKFVNIKYQMSWPGTGDPYYTAEGNTRRTYYGVSAVPDLYIEGKQSSPYSHSVSILNAMAEVPAKAKMEATATRNGKTISLDLTITPISPVNNNLRLFVAIVEKETKANKKSNGESAFYNVMKKFMTSSNGDAIASLTIGEPTNVSFTYTFNGEYRLPPNGNSNLINHEIENSVENFGNLKVVYWIQNISTKEVWQAGIVDPPLVQVNYKTVNEFGTVIAKIDDEEVNSGYHTLRNTKVDFFATPNAGYEVKEWKDGIGIEVVDVVIAGFATNEVTIESLNCDANIKVEFQTTHVNVNYTTINEFGTISATVEEEEIESGDSVLRRTKVVFTATPEDGYEVKEWRNNGTLISANNYLNEYIIQSLNTEANITVEFQTTHVNLTYSSLSDFGTVKATVDNAVIESGDPVKRRSRVVFTATPNDGYEVKEWKNNNVTVSGNISNTYTITSINLDVDVTVDFHTSHLIVKYSTVNEFGTLKAAVSNEEFESGEPVKRRSRVTFTATPNEGYKVKEWKNNGTVVNNNTTNTYVIATLSDDVEVTVEFILNSGVEKQTLSEVQLYPNPFTKSLTISNAENIKTVVITNILGQKIKEIKSFGKTSIFIDTNDLTEGVYLVTLLSTNGDRIVQKVVKQK